MILEREFSRRGLEVRHWIEEAATVAWESWRGLERVWGEQISAPWPAAEHLEKESMRAAIWADLRLPYLPGSAPVDRAGKRALQKGRIRRAVVLAMFPEDLLVDGALPTVTPPQPRSPQQ